VLTVGDVKVTGCTRLKMTGKNICWWIVATSLEVHEQQKTVDKSALGIKN
jgi:hypothetical protein